MDAPWVPPYFGSWDQLVQELLGNPRLGSGGGFLPRVKAALAGGEAPWPSPLPSGSPVPWPWSPTNPWPWFATAAGYLVSLLGLRAAAASAGETGAAVSGSIDNAIAKFIDDYCGTNWHPPWPAPGPGPWVFGLATELSLTAHTLQDGELRRAVLGVAGQVIQKGLAAASPGS